MKIAYLHDYPEYIDEVASRWNDEWGTKDDVFAVEKKQASVRDKANKGQVPFILIALVDGRLAATASIFDQDLNSMITEEPWLAAVFTKPEFRNMHIARKLVTKALVECKTIGYERVMLRTETAGDYWRNLGWGFLKQAYDKGDEPIYVFMKAI